MKVVPIVFTAAGQPLYCGQAERLATIAIRYCTAAQDRGCVIPGCDVPIMICQAHHFDDFAKGGVTTAEDIGWVCPYHHRRIDGWHLERRGGRVWTIAPPWLDPTQTPRLNTYFHPPDLLTEEDRRAAAGVSSRSPARGDTFAGDRHSTKINIDPGPERRAEPADLFAPHY